MKLDVPLPYATSERLTDYLCSENGQISLTIPDGVLPGFLIEAYNAAIAGQCHQAEALLTKQNLDCVEQLVAQGRRGAMASLLTLAMVLQRLQQTEEALQCYEALTRIEPHPLVLHEQALLYRGRGLFSQALACCRSALDLAADEPSILNAYAHDLINAGHLEEGLAVIQQQVEQGTVNAGLHSHLLLCSHYLPNLDQAALFQAHVRWARMHTPTHWATPDHTNQLDPGRRLRIGYISHTFCDHVAASQFEALLDGFSPDLTDVIGYGNIQTPDEVTKRLAAKMSLYRPIYGMAGRVVADLVLQDRVDILVCVTGHTPGHRLDVLAYKPAPIQVDWISMNTTGMSQVDYRLTDHWLDPPGADQWYVEKLVRLPGGFLRFVPHQNTGPVTSLPAMRTGYVTFGSFNCHSKINPSVVSLWSEVLRACPDSRFLLKCAPGFDPEFQSWFCQEFAKRGVSADRIRILGRIAPKAHWELYSQVDVALDTYPYNGCMTTVDALWMGVPVVSLCGRAWVSRMGLSVLTSVGFEKFVATSREQYVGKARALAANPEALHALRMTMRPRLLNSPLYDKKRFAGEVEQAFRAMWRHYCKQRSNTEIACVAVPSKSKPEGVTP